MKRSEATIAEHGRITLPAAVRAALKAKPGDRLIFDQDDSGVVHVRVKADPVPADASGRGDLAVLPDILRAARPAAPDEGYDDPVGDYLVAEDERTRSER